MPELEKLESFNLSSCPPKTDFPGSSAGKESTCNAGDSLVRFLGWEDSLNKGKATYSSILAWRIHGLYGPWNRKELDTTERLSLTYPPK